MTPSPDEYFLEIESRFAERRGTAFIFSAKDWALMKGWNDEGIPLPVVLEAIDKCFDSQAAAGRKKTISSLSYCRHAVKDLWGERKELHVGGGAVVPEESPERLLDELAGAVSAALAAVMPGDAELIEGTSAAIRGLRGSVPEIEQNLITVEERLLDELAARLPSADRTALESDLAALTGGMKGVDEATLTRTREAHRRRLTRARFGLPRLSLFG